MKRVCFLMICIFLLVGVAFAGNQLDLQISQELSEDSLSEVWTAERDMELCQVLLNLGSTLTSETVAVIFDSGQGSNYDVTLDDELTASAYIFRPTGRCLIRKGDAVRVTCTNANLTGSGVSNTVYGTIQAKDNQF